MTYFTDGVRRHLTNLAEWHKMGAASIFPPESRLELINGEILEMSPIGSNHAGHINRLNKLFSKLIPDDVITSIQNPLQLNDISEPEPDFMLLRADADFYSARHPTANDVLLLIEVADSSLEYDRTQKQRLYALHNIPEYWLVNLNDNCLEVHRQPHNESYAQKTILRANDQIDLTQLTTLRIEVADIF
jgi:Uma2 family endonuclease